MDKFEMFAVGHYFSEWPEDMNYSEFMEALRGGEDIKECWPVVEYEGIPNEDMFHLVDSMVNCLRITFK